MNEPQNDGLRVEWMPIDSAPKDGTEILIFSPMHGVAHVTWARFAGKYLGNGEYSGGWDACFNNGDGWGDAEFDPTHWRPVPPPPAPPSHDAPQTHAAITDVLHAFSPGVER